MRQIVVLLASLLLEEYLRFRYWKEAVESKNHSATNIRPFGIQSSKFIRQITEHWGLQLDIPYSVFLGCQKE